MIAEFESESKRLKIKICGAVQGVGFRPFIYRLARELGLRGWVNNSASGVAIEVEGTKDTLETFLLRLELEKPPHSLIDSLESVWLEAIDYLDFTITKSETGQKTAVVLPDLATCSECLQEIFDPQQRRFHYPFTNCTHCGPRYTIIESLPYDRPGTTMKTFTMCPQCQTEYENPGDRRFHAQPNACPQCGPQVELWNKTGQVIERNYQAILSTAQAIRQGQIIAVKGLGGFHLLADARNEDTIQQLRERKKRPAKPLAVMIPSLTSLQEYCQVSPLEAQLLTSQEAPIVLLKHDQDNSLIAANVAPNNPYLGVMSPYTPIHHLLMAELGFPIVATSGNLANEPICIDEQEVRERLGGIADLFLVHNRPILRPVDDSIVTIIGGREMILRRARGFAPLPITVAFPAPLQNGEINHTILAVGSHLKNTIAIAMNNQIFLSQHLGDLETPQSFNCFQEVIESFKTLYEFTPEIIACDRHPDYLSTQYAQQQPQPLQPVQHHLAHILACLAENKLLNQTVLGIAWDGTGYGLDGTIWGGEFFLYQGQERKCDRIAYLQPFPLPGGNKAIKEPRRSALGLLYHYYGSSLWEQNQWQPWLKSHFTPTELNLIQLTLAKKINTPLTSSIGRLFDGVAALLNLSSIASFEGEAAMQLEFITPTQKPNPIPPPQREIRGDYEISLKPLLSDLFQDLESNQFNLQTPPLLTKIREAGKIAQKFHNTLIDIILQVAVKMGVEAVALTGGCFQNRYLLERAIEQLQTAGFKPYWNQRVPPNDGGISLGQIVAVKLGINNG